MNELTKNDPNFQLIEDIRTTIYKIGKREGSIEELKPLLQKDTTGASYKCFFGTEDQDTSWDNPKGNNLLLLTIAAASSVEEGNKEIARQLTGIILNDAQDKLQKEEFDKFINFRYDNGTPEAYNNYSIDYDNTPLTLAIKVGLLSVASELVKLQAEVNVSCGYANFSPLHLAVLHYAVNPTDSSNEKLIEELVNNGADITAKDKYGHTAKDLLEYEGLGIEDLHLFTINNQYLKKELNPEVGQKYSFKELAKNKLVVEFFADKKFDKFKANWTNTNLFKQFLNEKREENGNKYIIARNGIDENASEDSFAAAVLYVLGFDTDPIIRKLVNNFSNVLYVVYDLNDAINGVLDNLPHRSFVDLSNNSDSLEINELAKLLGDVPEHQICLLSR
ncbi:ankyrin repeat domain-containing protein [Rickettsia endosymbiont of Culicoides newsteadi]|uniref:ankyrin repeat domain-containing protein n=1 Tax=Rickettsia endosymbiont of Culicoides newsteadi TaxID=1961830 RepID=UPI000B9A79CE|nr:ankyrin repeat domain-containing protein [Rickettsia endosymbiont of Culicoides newsteadi]OZG31302.1 hypothetical protein RiCNE_13100 [Rickettsia endosymbiont of Culicoides newsteadi]